MGRNKKLIKNTGFVFIGNMGAKLMSFFMLPLYTHWLSPVDYGTTDIINTYAMLLLNVIACDISDAIFIFPVGAEEKKIKHYFSTGFFFQIMCSIIVAIVFLGLSHIKSNNSFFTHIWFIYGILISNLFQKYVQDFCRGINKMSVFSFTGIINSLTIALFSILLIPQMEVQGYVFAIIIANIITGLFTFFYSHSYQYLSLKAFNISALREMLHFSIPLMPTAIMWWLISGLNRPLLEEYCSLFAVGLLAVALKLPSLINLIFGFFQQAWTITVIEEYKKKDFFLYYNKMYRIILTVQVACCIFIILFSRSFIHLMTTEEYYQAWKYIPLLAIGVIFSNISAFTGTIFSAAHKTSYTFYSVITGGVVSIICNFLFIPNFGLWGACLSIILAHLASCLSRIYFSSKFVKFTNSWITFWQFVLLLLCYLFSLFNSLWGMIIGYTISILLYFCLNIGVFKDIYQPLANRLKKTHNKLN